MTFKVNPPPLDIDATLYEVEGFYIQWAGAESYPQY